MSLVPAAIDLAMTYRFIRLLTQKWTDTPAFALGIIDENGKILRKRHTIKTAEEKAAYTYFHRLVWKIKRLLEKVPFGQTRIANYIAALWFLKEHFEESGVDEAEWRATEKYLLECFGFLPYEGVQMLNERNAPKYPKFVRLSDDVDVFDDGELILYKGDKLEIVETRRILGQLVFICSPEENPDLRVPLLASQVGLEEEAVPVNNASGGVIAGISADDATQARQQYGQWLHRRHRKRRLENLQNELES